MTANRESKTLEALWTPDQVAEYLKVPMATLYHWRHSSKGPPAIRVGRHLRYPADLLHEWVRSGLANSAQ